MHRELFPPEHERNGSAPVDGNSPLRQVLAALGGDAGPLACSAPANTNVLAGFLLAKYGAAARSPVHRRENLKVVSFAANREQPWQSGPPESAHCPATSRRAGPEITIILAICRNSCR